MEKEIPTQDETTTEDLIFQGVRNALIDSALLPKLQELFEQQNIDPMYYCFESVEVSPGFPVPVTTLYIVPFFEIDPEVVRDSDTYPGVEVSEIMGIGTTSISLRIGLTKNNFDKAFHRLSLIMKNEPDFKQEKPSWWQYPYSATNMTRPYDSAMNVLDKGELLETKLDLRRGSGFDYYIWDAYGSEQSTNFLYSKGVDSMDTHMWKPDDDRLIEAFSQMDDLITSVLPKG